MSHADSRKQYDKFHHTLLQCKKNINSNTTSKREASGALLATTLVKATGQTGKTKTLLDPRLEKDPELTKEYLSQTMQEYIG